MKNVHKKFINNKWNLKNIYETARESTTAELHNYIWFDTYTAIAGDNGTNSYLEEEIKAELNINIRG